VHRSAQGELGIRSEKPFESMALRPVALASLTKRVPDWPSSTRSGVHVTEKTSEPCVVSSSW